MADPKNYLHSVLFVCVYPILDREGIAELLAIERGIPIYIYDHFPTTMSCPVCSETSWFSKVGESLSFFLLVSPKDLRFPEYMLDIFCDLVLVSWHGYEILIY